MLPVDGARTRLPVGAADLPPEGRGPKRTHGTVWCQGGPMLPFARVETG